jgi:hypothetical protein
VDAPVLSGPGRFETLVDEPDRFHIRQSPLTERTLLAYTLTALVLAAGLLASGIGPGHRPGPLWLILLAVPGAALYLLRYSGELLADGQRGRLLVRLRWLGFRERAVHHMASDLVEVGVEPSDAGRAAGRCDVVLVTRTGRCAAATHIPAAIARRLARKVASVLGVPIRIEAGQERPADLGLSPSGREPPPAAQPALRPARDRGGGIVAETVHPGGFELAYPTRSPGTALVLLCVAGTAGPLALAFAGWALALLAGRGITFSRLMLLVPPTALAALSARLMHSGLCLLAGSESLSCRDGELVARSLLGGWSAGATRIPLEEIREVRVAGGVKVVWGDTARYLAAVLPPADQDRVCERIRTAWLAQAGATVRGELPRTPAPAMLNAVGAPSRRIHP